MKGRRGESFKKYDRSKWTCKVILRSGKKCGQIRVRDAETCRIHGGHQRAAKVRGLREVRTNHLPRFYRTSLCKTLTQFVGDCLDSPRTEQLSALEELALVRASAQDVVTLYDATLAATSDPTARAKAGAALRETMSDVMKMIALAASIEATSADKISAFSISGIIAQVVRIAHATIPEEQARAFEQSIRDHIKIATGPQGTTLTPDQDAMDMDESVPLCLPSPEPTTSL